MKRRIYKSGNSLVVTLTDAAKEVLELKEGDCVDMKVKNKKIIITKIKEDSKDADPLQNV
jgi:antitoxin component of MazEF toxin-antitoxin module